MLSRKENWGFFKKTRQVGHYSIIADAHKILHSPLSFSNPFCVVRLLWKILYYNFVVVKLWKFAPVLLFLNYLKSLIRLAKAAEIAKLKVATGNDKLAFLSKRCLFALTALINASCI